VKLRFARAALLLVTLPLSGFGAWVVWSQPSAYPWGDPTLYAVPGAGLLVTLLAFVASFAPFDRPQSTPRWTTPLLGLLLGLALAGLVAFPATFLFLTPGLLAASALLYFCGRLVAQGPPDLDLPTTMAGSSDDAVLDAPLDAAGELSPLQRGSLAVGVILGVALVLLWRPSAGARPLDPEAGVAAVTSRPPRNHRAARRVTRHAHAIEVRGADLRLMISLDRPRLELNLRDQDLIVEPCLTIEEGSVDGFPLLPFNAYFLEPTGVALADFTEGRERAWVRVSFPKGAARYQGLAGTAPFLGRLAGPDSIAATIEVEVELRTGKVTIDARTRLEHEATVSKASLGWIRLREVEELPVQVALGDTPLSYLPSAKPSEPFRFFSHEGGRTRLLEAKRGTSGPYETLEVGTFHDWLVLPSHHSQTLILAPDWRRQASLATSRSAGHGLPENALRIWRQGGGVNVLFDVASARLGEGVLLTRLPAGLYRNRLVLVPLRGRKPSVVAQALRRRFVLAERIGARIERVPRPQRTDLDDNNPPPAPPVGPNFDGR